MSWQVKLQGYFADIHCPRWRRKFKMADIWRESRAAADRFHNRKSIVVVRTSICLKPLILWPFLFQNKVSTEVFFANNSCGLRTMKFARISTDNRKILNIWQVKRKPGLSIGSHSNTSFCFREKGMENIPSLVKYNYKDSQSGMFLVHKRIR